MHAVTDADRDAAEELRVLLADVSGFWHTHGDTGPICMALARHRELAERRLLEKMGQAAPSASVVSIVAPSRDRRTRRHARSSASERVATPSLAAG
ncbi:hypothetical protein [Novosphingobium sp. 9U]|uniref:hypothetical protein n=1 Tax=Novosphingobium sp. 9U TaxID=2653158 RepID=UPI0012F06E1D|nr:hypothetical protein [Novosphingobium sp. 9U]VWX54259.1 hypothetical protein NOVOSPHI9U_60164 [Novosphingobium sp. 9U]